MKDITGGVDEGFDEGKFFGFNLTLLRGDRNTVGIRYLRMNIVDPSEGTVWGRFNNRAPNLKVVQDMCNSFTKNLDNCTDEHSMEVALDLAWLKGSAKSTIPHVDGKLIDEVPIMTFTQAGKLMIRNSNLWMLRGNHRRLAVIQYIKRLNTELEMLKEGIKKVKKGKIANDLSNMSADEKIGLEEAEKRIDAVKKKIDSSRWWAVKVYN